MSSSLSVVAFLTLLEVVVVDGIVAIVVSLLDRYISAEVVEVDARTMS